MQPSQYSYLVNPYRQRRGAWAGLLSAGVSAVGHDWELNMATNITF